MWGYTPVGIIGVLVVIVIESLLRDETGATVAHYRPEIRVS